MAAQVRQFYANLADVLAELGACASDVASETWYVTDMADFLAKGREIFAIRSATYGGDPVVTQTVVQVAALYRSEVLGEIQLIAHSKASVNHELVGLSA